MSSVHPRIIDQNANPRALHPMATDDRQYDESWLQKLLFDHPDLLPIADIDPAFGKLVPLAREFPVASGSIDVLYATTEGALCLVETKLWRNPEAHREVLAQLLDYAKGISGLGYAEFRARVNAAAGSSGEPHTLDSILKPTLSARGVSSVDFEANLRRSLTTGGFLLLIVGDGIRPEVALLSEVLGSVPNLEFTLALVEMNFYHLDPGANWPLLAAPTVVGRSHEVTRAVVRIRYEQKQPEVEVVAAEDTSAVPAHTSLEVFLKSLPSGLDNIFRVYLERWMSEPLTFVYWGKSGFSLRVVIKGKPVTIIDAQPAYISVVMEKYLSQMGDPVEAYRLYRTTVRDIPAVQQVYAKNGRYVYFGQVAQEQAQTLLEATDQFVRVLAEGSKQSQA